jgi:hypothetical protein
LSNPVVNELILISELEGWPRRGDACIQSERRLVLEVARMDP